MDPFSITIGVVSAAAVALHTTRRVSDFIDGIQKAPRAISALSKDLQTLKNVLETLNILVNQIYLSGKTARTDFIPLLKPPLENCTTALESILLAIKPYTKPPGEPKKSKWRGFVWTFEEREVLMLQKTLMDYKMSLDIAISVANLTTSSNGLIDIRKSIHGLRQRLNEDRDSIANSSFLGSSTDGSDHGYTLKRYLLETETVLGDSPPFGPATSPNSKGRNRTDHYFEPCAATASLLLFAQGSLILCLHHDTLAVERRFTHHNDEIQFISVDNISERGAGRLVISYDVGQTAIVWDLFTGAENARFTAVEPLQVAAWMRNGNVAFGNTKGAVSLFEPSTQEHIWARTIFDPITALAPASDCKTFAIGFKNGSILLAALHPAFTVLHILSTSYGPSPITLLAWHESSSKQKSDMLATQSSDGVLRVWAIPKPPTSDIPRVIRLLRHADNLATGSNWMAWSKNGRIIQYSGKETWSWDVRTKHVTYERVPTIEGVRAIASYGPTATLFTLGPQHTVQQYDLEHQQMVANVRHPLQAVLPTPPEENKYLGMSTSESEEEIASPIQRGNHGTTNLSAADLGRAEPMSPRSDLSSINID